MRILIALLGIIAAMVSLPARAGDAAQIEVLGFSADGRVFAFEEYGQQDGSGFPYAHRFYIDTSNDKFLPGTPIRVTLEDESASIADARNRARIRGEKIVKHAQLARNRGHTAAFNAITEVSADPYRIVANPRPVHPPVDALVEFRMEEFEMPAPERCEGLGGAVMGMRLLRIATAPGARTQLRHEDQAIPLSRGCPLGYRLGGLQVFYPEDGNKPAYALLIAIRRLGFEGPDFRWIAATGRL